MIHNIERIRKLLRLTYGALFMGLLLLFVAVVFLKKEPALFIFLVVFVEYALSYVIRDYTTSNILTLVLHVIMGVLCIFVPTNKGIKVLLALVAVHLLGESFSYARFGYKLKPLDDIPWPTFLVSLIIYGYGYMMHEDMMLKGAYYIPIVLLVIYYGMIYVDGLKVYVNATKDVSGLPLKRIVSTNTMIVLVIILFLVVGLLLGGMLGLDKALRLAGKGIIAVVKVAVIVFVYFWRVIAKFLSSGGGSSMSPVIIEQQTTREYATEIGNSFEFVLKGAVIVLAIYIVYKIAAKIIKRLVVKRKYDGDIIEVAEASFGDTSRNIKKKTFFGKRLTKEEKIRKFYKIRILRHRYEINLTSQKTPREIEEELSKKELGDVDEITSIYSDVRYGKTIATKDLIRKMNRLIKR